MNQKIIQITNEGSDYKINISGFLDEEVDFQKVSCLSPQKIEVNFDELKGINSCGIRGWVLWLRQYSNCNITYSHCPKIIIDQINMVAGFLPKNAIVSSFYVPYFNEIAGTKKQILFRLGIEFTKNTITPPRDVKDEHGNSLEIDAIESKYFKFITRL